MTTGIAVYLHGYGYDADTGWLTLILSKGFLPDNPTYTLAIRAGAIAIISVEASQAREKEAFGVARGLLHLARQGFEAVTISAELSQATAILQIVTRAKV